MCHYCMCVLLIVPCVYLVFALYLVHCTCCVASLHVVVLLTHVVHCCVLCQVVPSCNLSHVPHVVASCTLCHCLVVLWCVLFMYNGVLCYLSTVPCIYLVVPKCPGCYSCVLFSVLCVMSPYIDAWVVAPLSPLLCVWVLPHMVLMVPVVVCISCPMALVWCLWCHCPPTWFLVVLVLCHVFHGSIL